MESINNKKIVYINSTTEYLIYIEEAIKKAERINPNLVLEYSHISDEKQLLETDAAIVYITTSWILEHDTKWFYNFYDTNLNVNYIILLNHEQGIHIKELLILLNTLPLNSKINFIPIDNYSPNIIIHYLLNSIVQ